VWVQFNGSLKTSRKLGWLFANRWAVRFSTKLTGTPPIFPEMRALINKTTGVFSVLRSALHPLSKQIVAAFVYGSLAREEESAQSDVDLLVVGNATLDRVLSRLSKVEKDIGRPINPTVYSVAEFKSKLATGNHFLTAVLEGQKVFLLGDGDELRKVGGERLAKAGADKPR
jgi:predicted nucleotidyltransferase